jgi:HlyD family secretion protein
MTEQTASSESKRARAGWPRYAAGVGIVLLAATTAVVSTRRDAASEAGETPLYEVKSGPLVISISESGRLKNMDEIVIKNETERSLKILSLVEEGMIVKKDDILVELDSATLETERDSNELKVKGLESDLVAAEENREILKNQMQSNIDKEELALKFAKLDLERFTKGVHPQSLATADANIAIAEEDLERTEEDLEWSKKLHAKGFITLKELKADELSTKQKRINLDIKKSDRELLVKYTHPQEVETCLANVKQAEMALDRAQRTAKAELSGQQAKLLSVQVELASARKELAKAEERLVACKIPAPADGMVIYATSSGGGHRFHDSREPMEVGATVHPKHRLIQMPTSDDMQAIISVQEATKPKLREGMAAVLTVDALPGEAFEGKITKIGILPDSSQAWLNPDLKVYRCELEVTEASDRMRPGMNCHVEVVVEEHEEAMFVPIQCVLHVDEKPTVFLKTGAGFERLAVETGMDNNVMIHVLSGLQDGDKVMLAPPLESAIKKNGGRTRGAKSERKGKATGGKRESGSKAPGGKPGKPRGQGRGNDA